MLQGYDRSNLQPLDISRKPTVRLLPTGVVTLLFTDIEGSTRLLQQLGAAYAGVLKECRRLLRFAFQQCNGYEVDTQGDAFFVVFERASDAISAAVLAQRTLAAAHWPGEATVRVRIGLHTGEPQPTEEGYIGLDVHQAARIMAAAHGGQILLSSSIRDILALDLPDHLNVRDLGEFHLKDIPGSHRLFQLVAQDLPSDFPPPSTTNAHASLLSIPSPSTSFVGRQQEVDAICAQIRRPTVRLLTLLGTAGVGKTRLAIHVASHLTNLFQAGICFVPLDQVSAEADVLPAIAQALHTSAEKGHSLLEQVQSTLCAQSFLLILDNFEQVLPARPLLSALLASCPSLKALVTSRSMLHMQAEHLFEVPPLSVPQPAHLPDLSTLSQVASIDLFVQRAQAVQPAFQLTHHNMAAIASICQRLDGIPLAIELAAARVRHFPPHTLLAHLQQGLSVLQGQSSDIPERQQTLRSAITWSYDHLSTAEQQVFRRLSVCSHSASFEAAESICTAANPIKGGVLAAFSALVDQSMLHRRERNDGTIRYWLLLTLREYGREQLVQAGEAEKTQAAHAAHFLSWIERATTMLFGAEQADWLDNVDREYENLRSALTWLLEQAPREPTRGEQALRLCIALFTFWEIRGYIREGLALTEQALAESKASAPTIRALALQGAGFMALIQDDNVRAERFLRESQLLFRESGDKAGMANILRLQGNIAMVKNSYKLARRLLDEAFAIFTERGDTQKILSTREALVHIAISQCDYTRAYALIEENLAALRSQGKPSFAAYPPFDLARALFLARSDRSRARSLAEESLALSKTVGNKRLTAYTLALLGQILMLDGEYAQAALLLQETLTTFRALGEHSGVAELLMVLGRLALSRHDTQAAWDASIESWNIVRALDAKEQSAACLEVCAETLVALGQSQTAVQLWGTAATVRATIVAPIPPVYRSFYVQAVAIAREQLGEDAFQIAWNQGRATPLDRVTISRAIPPSM